MLKTTLVGSLPKPLWLAEPKQLWAPWKHQGNDLIQAKQDATILALKLQEDCGIHTVTDGEQSRTHFVEGFLSNLEGIDNQRRQVIGVRANRYEAEVPTVVGPIRRKAFVHKAEALLARAHTTRQLKFTLPGPMTIIDTVANEYYKDKAELAFALAEALNEEARDLEALGVDVIQFDEPAFNIYPQEVADWGMAALERAAQGLTCLTAVHICYGYGIKPNLEWKASLGNEWRQYEQVFPLLAKSSLGQVSLECQNAKVPMDLIKLLDGKQVMVGAIDVGSEVVETPEQVAATLRNALKFVAPENLVPCTNCGMAPMPFNTAYDKLRALNTGAAIVRRELGLED
jgi:5-methyltetrahydropteroyltriglutamate--homocysteine methyltransferase